MRIVQRREHRQFIDGFLDTVIYDDGSVIAVATMNNAVPDSIHRLTGKFAEDAFERLLHTSHSFLQTVGKQAVGILTDAGIFP
jgi:hypothetical protein